MTGSGVTGSGTRIRRIAVRPPLSDATRRWLCRIAAVLCVAGAAALAQQAGAVPAGKPAAGELRRTRLNAVASSRTFTTVNRNDAIAAIKVWFDVVAKARGFLLDSKVEILDSVAEIRQRLESHSVDVLLLDFVDYLQLEGSGLLVPELLDSRGAEGSPLYSYVLLVSQSSAAKTVADLRGKNALVSSRTESNTGLAWLDILLARQKLGRAASFFAPVRTTAKPQSCVLPLFFGSVDACVVDETNFELLKEMNPQLGKLRVLARAKPLLENLIATPVQPHPFRSEILDATLSLHQDLRGRQLLMVIKNGRLVPARPGDLDSTRELWKDYYRLTGAATLRAAGIPQASSPAAATAVTESSQASHANERGR